MNMQLWLMKFSKSYANNLINIHEHANTMTHQKSSWACWGTLASFVFPKYRNLFGNSSAHQGSPIHYVNRLDTVVGCRFKVIMIGSGSLQNLEGDEDENLGLRGLPLKNSLILIDLFCCLWRILLQLFSFLFSLFSTIFILPKNYYGPLKNLGHFYIAHVQLNDAGVI